MRSPRSSALALALAGGLFAWGAPPWRVAASEPADGVVPDGVEDGRGRFREVYCAIRQRSTPDSETGLRCEAELQRLAGEPGPSGRPVLLGRPRLRLRVLVVPGLYGDCLPVQPFADALPRLESIGHDTGRIPVGGFASVASNAARVRDVLAALDLPDGEPLVLVAFSKGVPDALEALVAYPEVRQRVKALVSIAGAVGGSPIAERLDSNRLLGPLLRFAVRSCTIREDGALADLRPAERRSWLARNPLPASVRYYSVAAFAERDRVSRILRPGYDLLAKLDARNDGAVIFTDAIVPGSKLLGFVLADHWAVALPLAREVPKPELLGLDRNEFPRDALVEAVVRTIEEDLLSGR